MAIEDYCDFYWPEDEYDDVVCKYCKRGGFTWDQTEKGWRLITITGRIHSCKAYLCDEFKKENTE